MSGKTRELTFENDVKLQQMQHAISETVLDECIIINLANGNYHRTLGLASSLWEELKHPTVFRDWLLSAQGHDPTVDPSSLARFGLVLLENDLILVEPNDVPVLKAIVGEEESENDARLRLETYDDMADLLLLDPIHEVGEHGWPHRLPATE